MSKELDRWLSEQKLLCIPDGLSSMPGTHVKERQISWYVPVFRTLIVRWEVEKGNLLEASRPVHSTAEKAGRPCFKIR